MGPLAVFNFRAINLDGGLIPPARPDNYLDTETAIRGDHRKKREKELVALASEASRKASKQGRNEQEQPKGPKAAGQGASLPIRADSATRGHAA